MVKKYHKRYTLAPGTCGQSYKSSTIANNDLTRNLLLGITTHD